MLPLPCHRHQVRIRNLQVRSTRFQRGDSETKVSESHHRGLSDFVHGCPSLARVARRALPEKIGNERTARLSGHKEYSSLSQPSILLDSGDTLLDRQGNDCLIGSCKSFRIESRSYRGRLHQEPGSKGRGTSSSSSSLFASGPLTGPRALPSHSGSFGLLSGRSMLVSQRLSKQCLRQKALVRTSSEQVDQSRGTKIAPPLPRLDPLHRNH